MPQREQDKRENGKHNHWFKERLWKKNKSHVLPYTFNKGPRTFNLYWVSQVMQPLLVNTLAQTHLHMQGAIMD